MKHLLVWIILSICASPAFAHQEQHKLRDSVSVIGLGEIESEPDQAILSVSVTAVDQTLSQAKQVADESYRSVLKVIKAAGIPDKQVKVVHLSMQPQYEWETNKQILKGQRVSRSLNITVNNLDKVAPLMQALVDNRVSTVDALSTGFQDRSALINQALGLATIDAKNKAKFLAEQLDRNLGKAIEIIENTNNTPIIRQHNVQLQSSATFSKAAPPDEMFGTQKIQTNINVRFELN